MKRRFSVCLALAALASPAAAATQVGVTSAVLPAARGTPPAREARVLQVGLDMQVNERVQTDAGGKAHLLFLDGSALSVGPNSDLTLDEFVYDPDKRTGKIALSATKGVFRLVGGHISKTTPVTLTTPAATVGVRGGIAIVEVGQQVSAKFLFGSEMTVAGAGLTTRVGRPGSEVIATAAGPGAARPLTEASVAASMGAFENQNEPAPGSPSVSDSDVAASQVTSLNSTAGLGEAAPAAGGGAPAPTGDAATGEVRTASQSDAMPPMQEASGLPDDEEEEDEAEDSPPSEESSPQLSNVPVINPPPPPPPPPTVLSTPTTFAGRLKVTNPSGSFFGADDPAGGAFLGAFTAFDTPFSAPVLSGGSFVITAGEATFAATSAGAAGTGSLVGQGFNFADEFFFYELVDQVSMTGVIAFVGAPTPLAAFPTSGATFYDVRRDFLLDSDVPFVVSAAGSFLAAVDGLQLPGPAAAILWDGSGPNGQRAFGSGAIAIVGQGAGQASSVGVLTGEVLDDGFGRAFLSGFMRGSRQPDTSDEAGVSAGPVASADDGLGNDFFGQAGPNYFLAEGLQVDSADMTIGAGVSDFFSGFGPSYYPNSLYTARSDALGPRNSGQLMGYAGGYARTNFPNFSFHFDGLFDTEAEPSNLTITKDAAANKLYADFQLEPRFGTTPVLGMAFGDNVVAADGRSAFIDDQRFLAIESNTATSSYNGDNADVLLYLTTSHALAAYGLLPAGVSFCACQYAVWGFFGGESTATPGTGDRTRIHLATWVAGPVSNAADIALLTGTATYSGHLIGTVQNGLNVYTAVGGLQLQADFGQQQITGGAITSFDGLDYQIAAGSFSSSGGLNTFSAGISGAPGPASGITGQLDGSFVGVPGNAAAEAIGQAHASSGTGYNWVGIFAGKR